jgi:hypothetical protein
MLSIKEVDRLGLLLQQDKYTGDIPYDFYDDPVPERRCESYFRQPSFSREA